MNGLLRVLAATRASVSDAASAFAHRAFLPVERRDDDLFLVEFPKSGITWLTFLMAHVNLLLSNDRRVPNFFNINDFVPDVQTTHHVGAPLLPVPGYRCFKSHAPYLRQYRKVFYLVRDPRHVMVSYWIFLNSLKWWHGTLDELIDHPRHGVRAWVRHVGGWIEGIDAAASFVLVRYEDLLADPQREVRRLYDALGIALTDELLSRSVERSSIENMRAAEELQAGHPAWKSAKFVRPGDPGGARQVLSVEQRERIEATAAAWMRRLGYGIGDARLGPVTL